jgi:hypothetical protein
MGEILSTSPIFFINHAGLQRLHVRYYDGIKKKGGNMTVLLWIYFFSMAIIAISAFTNKEARGVKVGKVTISTIVATLLIAVIPLVNTIVILGYIWAKSEDWRMCRRMT